MRKHGKDQIERRCTEAAVLIAEEEHSLTFTDANNQFLDAKLSGFDDEKHSRRWHRADPGLPATPRLTPGTTRWRLGEPEVWETARPK